MPAPGLRRCVFALRQDQSGAVGIYFALVMGAMLLLGLAGVDLLRVHLVRSRLWAAADAALLAAGRSLGTTSWATEGAAYFNANMGTSYMGTSVTISAADFVSSGNALNGNQIITLTVNASVPLLTSGFTAMGSLPISVTSQARRESRPLELAMVLDNTGSMYSNNNIAALRTDAQLLVTTLAGGATTLPNATIALVPFSAAVNPGTVAPSLITSGTTYDPSNVLGWKGCVVERAGSNAMADTDASVQAWTPYVWEPATDNSYTKTVASSVRVGESYQNSATGPNLGCPTPITPLTSNVATLTSAISDMRAWFRGGTLGDIGMAWGMRVLSPTAPFTEGVAWDSNTVTKAVILMTDGDTNFNKLSSDSSPNRVNSAVNSDYTGYCRLDDCLRMGTTSTSTAVNTVNSRLATMCTTLKNLGAEVYTVTFGNVSTTTASLYSTCASSSANYFSATDQTALQNAFTSIGGALSQLVLVR